MRIALLTDGISPYVIGGMQRHSFHLARHLLALGVELTLLHCVADGEEIPAKEEVERLLNAPTGKLSVMGFHFPKSGKIPGHYLRESYHYSCQLYEALKEEWVKFDFIYTKGYTGWCMLEHKQKGEHMAPVGVKFHGYEMFQKTEGLKGKLIQFMLRPSVVFLNRNANVVFSYGGEITHIIEQMGVNPDRVVNIPSGIDDAWIASAPLPQKGPRRMLFIGRNEKRKGIDDLIRCSDLIGKSEVEFHWIGPIPEHKKLGHGNCHYHGEVKDIEKLRVLIDQCQVLVAPSHAEGMPNVILEAMARGLAVIGTRVGAVPMLVDQSNGRLIEPMETNALKSALKELIAMPNASLQAMREASLARVSNRFRWSNVATDTLEAIERITFKNSKNA
jgi:glycosyltransferase involved in cell wall biosynthesis